MMCQDSTASEHDKQQLWRQPKSNAMHEPGRLVDKHTTRQEGAGARHALAQQVYCMTPDTHLEDSQEPSTIRPLLVCIWHHATPLPNGGCLAQMLPKTTCFARRQGPSSAFQAGECQACLAAVHRTTCTACEACTAGAGTLQLTPVQLRVGAAPAASWPAAAAPLAEPQGLAV